MTRLHEENLNTAEHFNELWTRQGIHRYDIERQKEFLKYIDSGKALDVGAGLFGFAQYAIEFNLKPNVKFHAIDFSENALALAKQKAPSLKCTLADFSKRIPFENDCFDMVGSGEVIEHMEDPKAFAKELVRVCRPQGFIVISTVDTNCVAAKAHGDYPEHLYEFTKEDLIGFFSPYGATAWRLLGNYHMIYCRKFI